MLVFNDAVRLRTTAAKIRTDHPDDKFLEGVADLLVHVGNQMDDALRREPDRRQQMRMDTPVHVFVSTETLVNIAESYQEVTSA